MQLAADISEESVWYAFISSRFKYSLDVDVDMSMYMYLVRATVGTEVGAREFRNTRARKRVWEYASTEGSTGATVGR